MNGETNLRKLLSSLSPKLDDKRYVFSTLSSHAADHLPFTPICRIVEDEGTTIVCQQSEAENEGLAFIFPCRRVTLQIHSSLEAVGLIAAVATQLAQAGISANVIAGYYHDHLFVSRERAEDALQTLQELSAQSRL